MNNLNSLLKKATNSNAGNVGLYATVLLGTTIGAYFAVKSSAKEVLPKPAADPNSPAMPSPLMPNATPHVSAVTRKLEEKIHDKIVSEIADKVVSGVGRD